MNLGLSLVMLMFQSAFSIWKNKISHVQAPGSSCKPGSWMLFSSIHLAKWLSCLKGARDQLLCRFKWTLIHLQSNKEKSNAVKRDFGAAGSGAQVVISSILLTSIDRKRQIPQVHGALRLVSVDKFWVCSPWEVVLTAVRMHLSRGEEELWHRSPWHCDTALNELGREQGGKARLASDEQWDGVPKLEERRARAIPQYVSWGVGSMCHTWIISTLMYSAWGINERSWRLWPSPRDVTSLA